MSIKFQLLICISYQQLILASRYYEGSERLVPGTLSLCEYYIELGQLEDHPECLMMLTSPPIPVAPSPTPAPSPYIPPRTPHTAPPPPPTCLPHAALISCSTDAH